MSGVVVYAVMFKFCSSELLLKDINSSGLDCQQVCEGFPKFYERAKEAMNQAKREGRVCPLFIRPSTQWYVFEERLQGDGSGVLNAPISSSLFGGTKHRSAISSVFRPTKDEFGVYHVCYSMHSSQIELKGALRLLDPAEVISTTPHCGICDFENPSQTPTNSVAIVEAVEHCVLEDRALEKGSKSYSCSPSKAESGCDNSPGKLIPLFGYAQYVLPPSPTPIFPSHGGMCSPPPSLALSSSILADNKLASTFQISGRALPSKAKRLFVEAEVAVETFPSKKYCISDSMPSPVSEPTMPAVEVALPPYHRSVSMPVSVASHECSQPHIVRSKSVSRFPFRRHFCIPEPLPSLLDLKRSCE